MKNLRGDALEIWMAGVDSVRAQPLVEREILVEGDWLSIGDASYHRKDFDRIVVVGSGKAATAMAAGFVRAVRGWRPVTGWVNVPAGTERAIDDVHVHVARPANLNEPTEAGIEGSQAMMALLGNAGPRDLCVALISGGGSALLPLPTAGISLNDKLAVTRILSGAGATIEELNIVRKHLSDIKGGGLLAACRAPELLTLVLSDVLGDPLDLIASGPTVVDSSRPEDALKVLAKFDPSRGLPASVYFVLEGSQTRRKLPQATSTVIVLGNNAVAVDSAGIRAEALGYNHVMQVARQSEGAAEDVGRHLADMALSMIRSGNNDCLITGGEPTVSLIDASQRGRGGRNQQLVLAAYVHLLQTVGNDCPWDRFSLMSGGTDGEDGPTDAAGAILDMTVHSAAVTQSLDPVDYLSRNDAYTFFSKTGGLQITGPTGTNVCDVRVVTVEPRR